MTEQILGRLPRFEQGSDSNPGLQLRQLRAFDSELKVSPDDLASPSDSPHPAAGLPMGQMSDRSELTADSNVEGTLVKKSDYSGSSSTDIQPESNEDQSLGADPGEADPGQLDGNAPLTVLETLMHEIPRIEVSARDEMIELVEGILRQIFPKLAELFLAEEIVSHLRRLMPVKAKNLKIRAPEPFASQLTKKLTDGQFAERVVETECLAANDDAAPTIEISWERGGVQFDFRSFLEDCLHHLVQSRSKRGV